MKDGAWSFQMTNKETILAACDSKYFLEHAEAFVYSAYQGNVQCHIDVINITDEARVLACALTQRYPSFTYSTSEKSFNSFAAEEKRVYYSCHRFYVAREWLERFPESSLLITDIDCYVNKWKNMFDVDASVGLYLRDPLPNTVGWENHGTHVAAGLVLLNHVNEMDRTHREFIDRVIEKIESYRLQWFVDQVALWETYQDMLLDTDNADKFLKLTDNELDWEFKPDTLIWTGKGDRKYNNVKYVTQKINLQDTCRHKVENIND